MRLIKFSANDTAEFKSEPGDPTLVPGDLIRLEELIYKVDKVYLSPGGRSYICSIPLTVEAWLPI